MITKDRLLAGLRESTYVEEGMITVFTNFTKALVKLTEGMGKEKAKKIDHLLTRLHRDSSRHKKMIEDLIKKIEKSPKNEY